MTDITLLDGGMGQELVRRVGGPAPARWSAQVMIDRPGLVREMHEAFTAAGATIATTNSYALHRDRLRASGNHYAATTLPDIEHQLHGLLQQAVEEARGTAPRIAGGIGPLAASYRPDLHPPMPEATEAYAEIAGILAPHVDLILFETIPSLDAAQACLAAGRRTGKPVWLALTVDDAGGTKLRSGEPVSEAASLEADAILLNCSIPEVIPAALDALSNAAALRGAYANGFTGIAESFKSGGATVDSLSARSDLTPEAYAEHAMRWIDHGATILGGCCEVGPDHIAEIRNRLSAAGHTVV